MIKEFCEPQLITDYKAILNVKRVFERNIEKVKYTQNRMFLFTKNGMYCISQIDNQYMTFISKKKLITRTKMNTEYTKLPVENDIYEIKGNRKRVLKERYSDLTGKVFIREYIYSESIDSPAFAKLQNTIEYAE